LSGGSFSTSYWSYQSVSGDSSPFNSGADTQDAWLTFGVTFNNVTSSPTSGSSTSGILGFTAGTVQQYNVAPAAFQGSNSATWTLVDNTDNFSSPVTLTSVSAVPEAETYLSVAALGLPAGLLAWVRRRRAGAKAKQGQV